jgi:phage terminase large subunit-like protein
MSIKKPVGDLLQELANFNQTTIKPTPTKQKQPLQPQVKKIQNPKDQYPPTGYNSIEGYKIFEGQKYYHGETDPYGNVVHAPILTHEEWAARYESFPHKEKVWNQKRQRYDTLIDYPPVKLNKIDLKIMDLLDQYDQLLILAYRDARKSTNLQRKVKRAILDSHLSVAYFADTAPHARKFSRKIRDELMNNKAILEDYGYVIDDDQGNRAEEVFFYWQASGYESSRDPGLMIGSLEGMGQTGGHPDVIAMDDVINEKTKNSETKPEIAIDWFSMQIAPMARGHTSIWIVGTMKDKRDLYNYLISRDMYKHEIIPAIHEWPNGGQTTEGAQNNTNNQWYYSYYKKTEADKPLIAGVANLYGGLVSFDEYDKENWSKPGRIQYYIDGEESKGIDKNRMAMQEFLLRRKVNELAFESEFQMNAISLRAKPLNFEKIQMFNLNIHPHKHEIMSNLNAFYDQAYGESGYADYNCVFIAACYDDKFYIIDIIIWRNQGDAMIGKERMLKAIMQKYPNICQFAIEMGQSNNSDGNWLIREFEKENVYLTPQNQLSTKTSSEEDEDKGANKIMLNLDDFKIKPEKKKKVWRIYNQWGPRLTDETIWMREGINPDGVNEFIDERESYPVCTHYDVLDAGGSCLDLCSNADYRALEYMEVGHRGEQSFGQW